MLNQARYWIGTLYEWTTPTTLPNGCCWLKGQQETCPTTGRVHTQLIAGFTKHQRLAAVKRLVGVGHWEPTRSSAADDYVHKENTRIEGTQFELGTKTLRRNVAADWDAIKEAAKSSDFDSIPSDIYIRYFYLTLDIISHCKESLQILLNRLRWKENVLSSGVQQARARPGELGKKQEWTLSLKILGLSGGTVTVVRSMLSSTNFAERSTLRTFYSGSIVIRALWRLKEEQDLCAQLRSGSLRT